MVEEESDTHATLKRHYMKRFPFSHCRYISDTAYADTKFIPKEAGKALNGEDKGLVIVLRDSKYYYFDPMKHKDDCYDSATKFFVEVCVPEELVTDPAGELTGKEWKRTLLKFGCKPRSTETEKPEQDRAENAISKMTGMALRIMDKTGAPLWLWPYAMAYACAIHNHTALQSLGDKTPWQMVHGYTPDISVFWSFLFWQPIRYFINGAKFPLNKEFPARLIGIAWETGDMLTYHILPDDASRNNPTVLTRSVIIPDDGNNKRCNEIRLMGSEYAISMQKKYPKSRKSPRLEKLWPKNNKKEEHNPSQNIRKEEVDPPQRVRKEEAKENNNGKTQNKTIPDTHKEDELPHGNEKEETNNNHKRVTFNKDVKYKTQSVTKRAKIPKKRKSPRLAKIQRRTKMTSTTTEEYEHNKHRRYYIRNQTKSKNDVTAESQPVPDITMRRAQTLTPTKETNLNEMLQEDIKCARLNKHDKVEEYQHVITAINKNTYGINDYQTELLANDNNNELFNIEKILDHKLKNNRPMLKVKWHNDTIPTWETLATIKRDDPLLTAEYIYEHKLQEKIWQLKWARRLIYKVKSTQKRLQENIDIQNRQSKRMQKEHNIMFGVKIPNKIEECFEFDKINGNNLWTEAIRKEIAVMIQYQVFEVHTDINHFPKEDGWQFAKLIWVFAVKHDGRHKARLCIGGHTTIADEYDTYASTVKPENVRLQLFLSAKEGMEMISGDIGSAYLNAYTKEKIWTRLDAGFGPDLDGKLARIIKALYGLKTSANVWYFHLCDSLREMGFKQCKLDSAIWYRLREDESQYDYFSHHVDDFLLSGDTNIKKWIDTLELSYTITGKGEPKYHLGHDIDKIHKHCYKLGSRTYVKNALDKVKRILNVDTIQGPIKKAQIPYKTEFHPELDKTELHDEKGTNDYQKLAGIAQWITSLGRADLNFPVNQLARYNAAPRTGHTQDMIQMFAFLNKWTDRYLITEGKTEPDFIKDLKVTEMPPPNHLKEYYKDSSFKDLKDRPIPKGKPVIITIFVDSSHANMKDNMQSVTGILIFIGDMLIKVKSKRQKHVESSTYSSEFSALREAVEDGLATRLLLQSLGVPIQGPVRIYCDSKSILDSATNTDGMLKRRHVVIAYHVTREAYAIGLVKLYHIAGEDNPADHLTKGLEKIKFFKHTGRYLKTGEIIMKDN